MGRLRLARVEFLVCASPGCTRQPEYSAAEADAWETPRFARFLGHLALNWSRPEPSPWRRILDCAGFDLGRLERFGQLVAVPVQDEPDVTKQVAAAKLEVLRCLNRCLPRPDFYDAAAFAARDPARPLDQRPAREQELRRELDMAVGLLGVPGSGSARRTASTSLEGSRLSCLNRLLLDCCCEGLLPVADRTSFLSRPGAECPVCQAPFEESRGRRTTKDKLIAVDVLPGQFDREARFHCPECDTFYTLQLAELVERLRCAKCRNRVFTVTSLPPDLGQALAGAETSGPGEVRRAAALIDRHLRSLRVCPNPECGAELPLGRWCPRCRSAESLPPAATIVWVFTGNARLEPDSGETDGHEGGGVDPLDRYSFDAWSEDQHSVPPPEG